VIDVLASLAAAALTNHFSKPEISDSDLSMFICPAEPEDPKHPRPKPGTREFVRMYRDLDLSWDVDLSRYTSYAGPDWAHWNAKQPGDARKMDLWACDRCRDARFHHERGIAVLFADTARVELLRPGDVPGLEEDRGILIGADSPVDLFRRMTFAGSAVHR
ncbi:MAG: hypothetical protein MUE73_19155, partial [Planctomycetes bacterium]|nr:hypothetical protein [Planctomycetota bacterium]